MKTVVYDFTYCSRHKKCGVEGSGKSAYETWLSLGNTGSEADFIKSLKGEKGDKGDKGDSGTATENTENLVEVLDVKGNVSFLAHKAN